MEARKVDYFEHFELGVSAAMARYPAGAKSY